MRKVRNQTQSAPSTRRDFHSFITDESGAVTTDWVVLTAVIVGLSIATAVAVRMGAVNLGDEMSTGFSEVSLSTLRDEAADDDKETEIIRGTDRQRGVRRD